jgi:hypothetical protein
MLDEQKIVGPIDHRCELSSPDSVAEARPSFTGYLTFFNERRSR